MTIRSFDLLQPRSLPEAVEMLAKHGDDARALGGGTTLIILMKQRALYYRYLVDLQTIPGLADIKSEADGVRVGALVTHRTMEQSAVIRQTFPVVAEAFSHIGNVRVRQTASVGGNLAHADYRLDPPPALLVLGAEITAFGPKGLRTIPLKDFFRDMYETALEPGELLVDVKIPYGRCKELRVALGGVAATPLLMDGLEFANDQSLDSDVIDKLLEKVDEQISPFADLRGSEWYKRRMARVFVKKAVEQVKSWQ